MMLEISVLCNCHLRIIYVDLSCFFIVENPPLMKHFCDCGITVVNNHCAVGGSESKDVQTHNCCPELTKHGTYQRTYHNRNMSQLALV